MLVKVYNAQILVGIFGCQIFRRAGSLNISDDSCCIACSGQNWEAGVLPLNDSRLRHFDFSSRWNSGKPNAGCPKSAPRKFRLRFQGENCRTWSFEGRVSRGSTLGSIHARPVCKLDKSLHRFQDHFRKVNCVTKTEQNGRWKHLQWDATGRQRSRRHSGFEFSGVAEKAVCYCLRVNPLSTDCCLASSEVSPSRARSIIFSS
jgi:hypothetical protein